MGQGGQLLGEAYVKVSLDGLEKLDRQVDNSGRKFMSEFGKMETQTQKLGRAFGGLGGIIATLGVAKLGSDIIGASTKMDTMNRMLINVEGSQAKANKRFEQFRILAKEPVLDPFNLSKYYVGLKSVNVEADLSIRFMKALANAMAGVGSGNEDFARSMEQVVQMMGKGKLVGQDLRVIAESFPQIRKYLAEAFGGIVDPEELAKKGYTALDVLTKLNEVMEKQPHFTGGAQAAQDNFRQSLVLLEAAIGKDLLPTFSKFLDFLTSLMDKFSALPEPIKAVLGTTALGGLGLLGVGTALAFIVSTGGNAVKVLKELAGVNIATSAVSAAAGAGMAGAGVATVGRGRYPSAVAGYMAGEGLAYEAGAIGANPLAWLTLGNLAITAASVLVTGGALYIMAQSEGIQEALYGKPYNIPNIPKQIIEGTGIELSKTYYSAKFQSAESQAQSVAKLRDVQDQLVELEKTKLKFGKLTSAELAKQAQLLTEQNDLTIELSRSFGKLVKIKTTIGKPPAIEEKDLKFLESVVKRAEKPEYRGFAFGETPLQRELWRDTAEELRPYRTVFGLEGGLPFPQYPMNLNKIVSEMLKPKPKFYNAPAPVGSRFDSEGNYIGEVEPERVQYSGLIKTAGGLFPKADVEENKRLINAMFDPWRDQLKETGKTAGKVQKDWKDFCDDFVKLGKKAEEEVEASANKMWYKIGKGLADTAAQMGIPIINKGIEGMVGGLFEESRLEADWARYQKQWKLDSEERSDMGRKESKDLMLSYEQFSSKWKAQQDINKQTWKEFLQDMLVEWTKMLTKKLVYYGLEKAGEWVIDKLRPGEQPNWQGYQNISGNIGEPTIADFQTSGGKENGIDWFPLSPGSSQEAYNAHGWGHTNYRPGSISDWFTRDTEADKAWKRAHPNEYATGGSGIVTRPTMFMMGEAGPERFNIQPLSKAGNNGFGGGVTIQAIHMNITTPTPNISEIKRNLKAAINEGVAEGWINSAVVN